MNYKTHDKTSQSTAGSPRFGMFYSVKLTANLSTEDMYGEPLRLRKGKRGSVLQPGKSPGSYIIEFHISRGMNGIDFTQVEVSDEVLDLESAVGEPFKEADWHKAQLWFDVAPRVQ